MRPLRGQWIGDVDRCSDCEREMSRSGWMHDLEREYRIAQPDTRYPYRPVCLECGKIWTKWLAEEA